MRAKTMIPIQANEAEHNICMQEEDAEQAEDTEDAKQAKDAKDAHKQLQDQAIGVEPLAEQARAELDQQLAHAQQQFKTEQAQLKQLELQHTWLKELREWQERKLSAVEQLQQAQQH